MTLSCHFTLALVMTNFRNEVILLEYNLGFGGEEQGDCLYLAHQLNMSSVPHSKLSVQRIRPGEVSYRQEHEDREADPKQEAAGQEPRFC